MAEKNNELLIKNHQSRLTGSAAFSEANVVLSKNYGRGYNHGRGRGRDRGRGRGRERGRSSFYSPSRNNAIYKKSHVERHDKGKMFVKVLFRILKIPVINVAPKGIGLECVERRSTSVSFTRHP